MGKLFGTDGIRGKANDLLSPELVYKIARCAGYYFTEKESNPKILIGKDTRISGDMIEAALVLGFTSVGVDVVKLGVVTTPAVAYLTKNTDAAAGVMISASHNPMEDNGIKFFSKEGFKLPDEVEEEIEELYFSNTNLPYPTGAGVGRVWDDLTLKNRYLEYLKTTVKNSFQGIKLALDCANGGAYYLAPELFASLGAEVQAINNHPDGTNINLNCGSTHPEKLAEFVKENGLDLGFAFDGDADRLIAVDKYGEIIDGDYILAICGKYLKEIGRLPQDVVVGTVMANLGFDLACQREGLKPIKTKVGDRYVLEEMLKGGYALGGEQSGHIIFLEYSTTGDGLLTAIQLLDTLISTKQTLDQAKGILQKLPQVLVNVKVQDKEKYSSNGEIAKAISEVEEILGSEGRVLVRPSGTENLIRVMIEGKDLEEIKNYAQKIAGVIEKELA
ncbi:phosphoglucosamine mutase [Anaerobranca californiensis DSM 14826]|uniref:Phosphoglucosamine mutase n=1 Tax=Anaerobranca californiensis DSM 14826 TaxID=1120989 RepID=A0A1M6MXU8_9FIRM|nr:phosphoglucosamine mutase [Anaerobranca californiensis]SHJ88275.1 phosphoglucosamine mutase [Anaerobranca californiensis DSM 14826]